MGYSDRGTAAAQHHQQHQLSERDQRRLQYEREATEAREEWDRAVAARRATESAPAGPAAAGSQPAKPRVRYHEVKYDNAPYNDSSAGGWGQGTSRGQQPAYAGAGGGWGQAEQGGGAGGKEKGPPGWLEMLGKVYAGGPDL